MVTRAAAFARDARRERTFTTQEIGMLRDVDDDAPEPAEDAKEGRP
ncbi:hypothetical protein ACL02T_23535 [Pseudonocardia sp. RS010]